MPIRRTDATPIVQPNANVAAVPAPAPAPAPPAGPATSTSPSSAPNPFERANVADAVRASEGGAPAGGQSALATRIGNATGARAPSKVQVAMDEARALVPTAAALGSQGVAQLARFVQDAIAKAFGAGEDRARLDGDGLRPLIAPLGVTEDELVEALSKHGHDAALSGRMSGGLVIQLPPAGDAAGNKRALAAALQEALPSAPSSTSVGAALGALINTAIAKAATQGETSARLETGALDAALKPLRSGTAELYDDVAKLLGKLGYTSSADGFVGVSFGWQAPASDKLTAAALGEALEGVLPRGGAHPGPAGLVADLVTRKIAEAGDERSIRLKTAELDAILSPAFTDSYEAYETIAKALEAKGFQASSDGFVGVSASW